MPQYPQPIQLNPYSFGGNKSVLDVTAAVVVKPARGTLFTVAIVTPGTPGNLTINDSNALVTAQTITGITQASNAVVTLSTGGASNPFAVGNTITFASVAGMTQINALVGSVIAAGGTSGAWTVTTSINSSAFTAWSSGGTAASFGAGNQILSSTAAQLASLQSTCVPLQVMWPILNGIVVSSVPTSFVGSIAFS
jgi:hypothetical protein